MDVLAVLESSQGVRTSVEFDDDAFRNLARAGRVDSFIVATEEGFSPLGGGLAFFPEDLGISGREIKHLADWNRFQNPKVSLVALRSRRAGSLLRGLVLAASESSESYKQFAVPRYGRPYRDFYYNVTYEAIAYVCGQWGARRLALSHLSGCGTFHEDIATCNAEALAHYCDAAQSTEIDSFTFVGCCISAEHLSGIARLNSEAKTSRHRPTVPEVERREGHDLVHLSWGHES